MFILHSFNLHGTSLGCFHTIFCYSIARSCETLAIPWTVACQVPLSLGFSRQEYLSGLPFPSPGELPYPGIVQLG